MVVKLELSGTYLKLEPKQHQRAGFEVHMLQGGCGWSNFSYSSGGNAIAPESRCYFRGRLVLLASSGRTNQKM